MINILRDIFYVLWIWGLKILEMRWDMLARVWHDLNIVAETTQILNIANYKCTNLPTIHVYYYDQAITAMVRKIGSKFNGVNIIGQHHLLISKSSSLSLFLLLCQINSPPIATSTPAPTATPAPVHKPNVAIPAKSPLSIVLVLVTVPVVTIATLVPHRAAGTTLNTPNFTPNFANFLAWVSPLTPHPVESRYSESIFGRYSSYTMAGLYIPVLGLRLW